MARVDSKPKKPNPMGGSVTYNKAGLDAFATAHIPLPRPVSSYTVLRSTRYIESSNKAFIFSPMNYQEVASNTGDQGDWTNFCGVTAASDTSAVNASSGWTKLALPTTSSDFTGVFMAPSAISVRVYNTNAFQTTAGIVVMGRVNGEVDWNNETVTIKKKFEEMRQYNSSVAISAAELALQPRQIDGVPLDFNQVSNFTDMRVYTNDAALTWTASNGHRPSGFTPIFIHNPNGISLTFEICMEMRCRYTPERIYATLQKHYPPSPIGVWDAIMRDAHNSANSGVRNIPGHGGR
jgi:hypothetical protein